jgi:hypothetical protein
MDAPKVLQPKIKKGQLASPFFVKVCNAIAIYMHFQHETQKNNVVISCKGYFE